MAVSISVFRTPQELALRSAQAVVNNLGDAIQKRGTATIALSGGTTPKAVYELLATPDCSSRMDWKNTHLFWGDERCVPPDHPDSNYRMVRQALLESVSIPAPNIHRVPVELPPSEAASRYEEHMLRHFGPGAVEFDLVLLGMGDDGHTASLFPGTTALDEQQRTVTDVFVPRLNAHRVTLTFPAINRSRTVLFIVAGKSKSPVLRDVLETKPGTYPVERVLPARGELLWYLDGDAASLLSKKENA